ncbi:hypothetical protein F0562_007893 [Nyssa sinensis]|uniref:Uncharacterized protein n=1 Tax=Nyssa sinensis TaxID=561372 RepID=A0A5J5A9C6_9ASTE|nr:hypothetical protein F0562_007893 [Nyssa sinensis]
MVRANSNQGEKKCREEDDELENEEDDELANEDDSIARRRIVMDSREGESVANEKVVCGLSFQEGTEDYGNKESEVFQNNDGESNLFEVEVQPMGLRALEEIGNADRPNLESVSRAIKEVSDKSGWVQDIPKIQKRPRKVRSMEEMVDFKLFRGNQKGAKMMMKSPNRVMMKGCYEHREPIDNDGSCFSPKSLFALPPDNSSLMLDSFHHTDESSDQDLLLDVPSNSSFPQAELLLPTSSFGAQASACGSSVCLHLARP